MGAVSSNKSFEEGRVPVSGANRICRPRFWVGVFALRGLEVVRVESSESEHPTVAYDLETIFRGDFLTFVIGIFNPLSFAAPLSSRPKRASSELSSSTGLGRLSLAMLSYFTYE